MKFDGTCTAGCGDKCNCLVGVELYKGQYPASNLAGRMCPRCGMVRVVDLYGEIVTENIPELRMKIALIKNGILTGKIVFWEFESGKFVMSEESAGVFPKGSFEAKLPYFKKEILSGGVFEAGISLDDGTIGGFKPLR